VNPDGTLKEEAEAQGVAEEGGARNPAEEINTEAQGEQAAAAEAHAYEHEHGAPGEQPPIPLPDMYSTLQILAWEFAEIAWIYMGLHLAPGHKEAVKDLEQAKLAIDTLVFISDKLHSKMSDEDRRATRALISDLQLNFVRQSQ